MSFITEYISVFFTSNPFFNGVVNDFYAYIISKFGEDLYSKINPISSRVLSVIANYDFEKFYISYTTSDSVFFRFKLNGSNYEFKLEVFLDYDDECESALHIYLNGEKEMSTYGTIDYTLSVIADRIFSDENNSYDFQFYWEYPEAV